MGPRIRTFVEAQNDFAQQGRTPGGTTQSDTHYVYDGWNMVLELDGEDSSAIVKKYAWDLDVLGSFQGAGGLLACEALKDVADANDDEQCVYANDGNGNVMALTDSAQNQRTFVYDGAELAR